MNEIIGGTVSVATEDGDAASVADDPTPTRLTPSQDPWSDSDFDSDIADSIATRARAKTALALVMERETRLGCNGYRFGNPDSRSTPAQGFERNRAQLADAVDEFSRAVVWLSRAPRTRRVNRRSSSYGWKHVAERQLAEDRGSSADCYISNGAFIAAAIHVGFVVVLIPGSPNAWLNISRRADQ